MRYLVIGTSGAGKSTFAKKLARKIRASYIELDSHYWGQTGKQCHPSNSSIQLLKLLKEHAG